MIGFDDLINVSSLEISWVNGEPCPVKKISNSLIDISFLVAGTYFFKNHASRGGLYVEVCEAVR